MDNDAICSDEIIKSALYGDEKNDARMFIKLFLDKFRFDRATKEWLEWRGQDWQRDVHENVFVAVEQVADLYSKEADRLSDEFNKNLPRLGTLERMHQSHILKALYKRALSLRTLRRIKKVIRLASTI